MPRKEREMRDSETPWWETGRWIIGFEEDPPKPEGEDEETEEDDDDGDEGDATDSSKAEDDLAGLKSALRKERRERKSLEREAKARKAAETKTNEQEASELVKEREAREASDKRVKSLATGLLNTQVGIAVTRAATKAGFHDPEDAIRLIDRDDLDIEQDEENPASIEIDAKSVEDAVKALAKKKPHLIGKADGKEDEDGGKGRPTGSPLGTRRGTSQQTSDEDKLRDKYPALRR